VKTLFYGTPETAVPFLRLLSERTEVAGVVSQPDKPAGRGLATEAAPVKRFALEKGLKLFQPGKPSEIAAELRALSPDLGVAVAYGRILKPDVLAVPRLGTLNVHFSLLPKFRGAAPVQWSLARGETRTGVTLFWLDEGMDTGPILLQKATDVGPDEAAPELLARLTALGVDLLKTALDDLSAGKIARKPQEGPSSLAPLIKREDAELRLDRPAKELHDRVRGMRLWPRAYLELETGRLLVLKTSLAPETPSDRAPGTIVSVDRSRGILVQCGSRSCLWLSDVQPEGKKPTPAAEFLNGLRLGAGGVLPVRRKES
jgi:methionyl-tRNA formyltransferase